MSKNTGKAGKKIEAKLAFLTEGQNDEFSTAVALLKDDLEMINLLHSLLRSGPSEPGAIVNETTVQELIDDLHCMRRVIARMVRSFLDELGVEGDGEEYPFTIAGEVEADEGEEGEADEEDDGHDRDVVV